MGGAHDEDQRELESRSLLEAGPGAARRPLQEGRRDLPLEAREVLRHGRLARDRTETSGFARGDEHTEILEGHGIASW